MPSSSQYAAEYARRAKQTKPKPALPPSRLPAARARQAPITQSRPGTSRTGAGGYTFTNIWNASAAKPYTRTYPADSLASYIPVRQAQDDAELQRQFAGFMPPPAAGGGGGGGGGYGGGGGGGGAAGPNPDEFNAYAEAMKKLIGGMPTSVAAMQNPLTSMIDPAVNADVANARNAYSQLAGKVSMNDPYAALQMSAAPQLQGNMEGFLRGQGVDPGEYGNAVTAANAQLGANDANWQNLSKILGQNHLAGQRSTVDTNAAQGELIASGLEGQRTQLQALAALQQAQMDQQAKDQSMALQKERLAALMQLLGTGLQYGVTPDLAGMGV